MARRTSQATSPNTSRLARALKPLPVVRWVDGHVRLIDQTLLPDRYVELDLFLAEEMWEAIRSLRVRGAPAIGIAAAFRPRQSP